MSNKNEILISEKTGKIKLFNITNSNIYEINHNLNFLEDSNSQGGLLEILYHNDEVYISYTENRGESKLYGPTSTSIAKAKFNRTDLNSDIYVDATRSVNINSNSTWDGNISCGAITSNVSTGGGNTNINISDTCNGTGYSPIFFTYTDFLMQIVEKWDCKISTNRNALIFNQIKELFVMEDNCQVAGMIQPMVIGYIIIVEILLLILIR